MGESLIRLFFWFPGFSMWASLELSFAQGFDHMSINRFSIGGKCYGVDTWWIHEVQNESKHQDTSKAWMNMVSTIGWLNWAAQACAFEQHANACKGARVRLDYSGNQQIWNVAHHWDWNGQQPNQSRQCFSVMPHRSNNMRERVFNSRINALRSCRSACDEIWWWLTSFTQQHVD